MKSKREFCLLLAEVGVTAKKYFQLVSYFGGTDYLTTNNFSQVAKDKQVEKILGENYLDVLDGISSKKIDALVKKMQENHVDYLTCYDEKFPQSLKDIDDNPYLLFYRGNVDLLNSDCIAVVGTRKSSSYGRRVAKDFTKVLSENFTIVSGLAYGIDSIAHETTLEENGKTIAVLGGSVVDVYPSTNQNLANKIVEKNGLIVSEYGINSTPMPYHFPHRNRIVSGLSMGLLVCQAPSKSGTLSTVELALEQGKDVFVVPGEVYDAGFSGSNALIKSMQGACVTSPRDICDYYHVGECFEKKQSYQLSIEEQLVVNILSDGKMSFSEIVVRSQLKPSDLNFLLANLELKSIIAKLPGNYYRLYGGIE